MHKLFSPRWLASFTAITLAFTLGAFTLGGQLFAQDDIHADRRLPPGVLVYLSTPDIPDTYEAFKQTSYGQLINGPELEEFRVQLIEKFEQEVRPGLAEVEAQIGMPLSDLWSLMAGEVSFAVIRPIGQPLSGALFLEVGDHEDILAPLFEQVEFAIANGSDLQKQTDMIGETEVHFYSIPTELPAYPTIDVTYFLKDGQLVISSSRNLTQSILDRWDGTDPVTFADDELYSAILKGCLTNQDAVPDTIYYMNPISLLTAGLELIPDPQVRALTGMIPLYLPTVGLNRFKATGSTMELDEGPFSVVSRSMMLVDLPTSGILKMFELRPTISTPSKWVPADATQYIAADWNIAGAYAAVQSMYDGFLGPGAFERQVTELTRQANQENLNLKSDVIDVLTGKGEFYITSTVGSELEEIEFGAAFGVHNEEQAWKLIEGAIETASDVEQHEFRGHRVYSTLSPDDTEIAVTVANNAILIASSVEQVGRMIANEADGGSLVDSKSFQQGQPHLPEKVSMLTYQSPASQLREAWEQLRKGELDALTEGQFDFSVLPPFAEVEKYFVPNFGYVVPDEQGAITTQFQLHAE